jgi:hypothetical protein
MMRTRVRAPSIVLNTCGLFALAAATRAAGPSPSPPPPPEIHIARTQGAIAVDGDLDDAGWRGVLPVETWFETNPGDNIPPSVKNLGYVTYDDRYFYAAFDFQDPDPGQMRAPLTDRDGFGGDTDYAGVILDTRHDGKTGVEFLVNPRGVQFDGVLDDVNGNEDVSPDFFWQAAARVTSTGWRLEMRIPFSTLRYPKTDPVTWGVVLYRNYPRQYRTQIFTMRLPRGGNCFVCRFNTMTGLSALPSGGHVVIAPYVNTSEMASPRDGLGTPLVSGHLRGHVGGDLKWIPSASAAVDATINPDFSQIESDVAQIGSNERFALFFPEKRPFFLEGSELLLSPIQAVYTRTITSPRWGVRGTGKWGNTAYTALLVEDRGGGSVILPGPNESDLADQEFRSYVAVGRLRRDVGRSVVSLLATDREIRGGGYNRVLGPDFQWRPSTRDTVTGQVLFSRTETPDRPDLADEWTGQSLKGHGLDLWYSHQTPTVDWFGQGKDFSDGFRAYNGFVPQVGYRSGYAEAGRTFRPQGFLRRIRTFAIAEGQADREGGLINREYSFGAGMDGRFNSFMRFRYGFSRVRAGETRVPRQRLYYNINASPTRWLNDVSLEGFVGQEADFANARTGTGADVRLSGTLRPSDHLELRLNTSRRWLDVAPPDRPGGRLFTAQVERVRATYTLTSRVFLRLIGQYVDTRRDPSLFVDEVARRDASFSGSALFAYKLNWQTVLFVGYGDNRALSEEETLEREDRQFFLKLSYAFQR